MTEPDSASPAAQRFPCPCCGHMVFDEGVGSFEICPVCFWEDDLVQTRWPDFVGGPNGSSLIECQRNYQTFGANDADQLRHVRPPAENEPLDPDWYPLGPAALDCFESIDDHTVPWPEDRTVLYWWRPDFWRTRPPRWTGWIGAADLADQENWHGGFYELGIELADTSDEHLQRVLTLLWNQAGVEGCYRRRADSHDRFDDVPCTVAALAEHGHLRGTVLLPDGQRVVCGVVAIRGGGGSDWLDFYIPMGALSRTDQQVGGFPFGPDGELSALDWRRPLDSWLAGIATAIFESEPFRLGLIGHELSGDIEAADLDGHAPEERFIGYLLPLGSWLHYVPANR